MTEEDQLRETVVYTPAAGHAIEQAAERSIFAPTLASGAYKSVTGTVDWQLCLEQFGNSPIMVFGWDPGADGSFVGVRVPNGSHLTPDPAQHMPDDDSGGASAGGKGSST